VAISSAAAVIDVRVNNLAALKKLEGGTRKIQQLFDQIKQQRNVFDQSVGKAATKQVARNLRELIKGFAEAKDGSRQFQVALEQTTSKGTTTANRTVRMYSKTLAGLGAQLQAVDQILANSTVGQQDFNNALVVSNKLTKELTRNQLTAAAAEAKAGAGGVKGLLELGKDLPNSVKALELYQAELNDLQRTVDRTSDEFFELGKEIERVDLLLSRGPRQGQGPKGRTSGGGGRPRNRFQDIATGAGFPLLFGGGPIQSLAGGIGGAVGGLGGSIAASAIVSQVEAFATAAAQTGVALTSTGGALDFMREKSLFSSDAAREHAAVLEEQGRVQELAAHLGQEMAKAIGNNGVQALRDLGDTTKETTRLWSLLTTQLFRLVSGPLDAFLKAINQVLGGITTGQQFAARKEDLGAEGAAALEARVAELQLGDVSGISERRLNRGARGVGAMSLVEARRQALSEEAFQVAAAPLPVTKEDERRSAVSGKKKRERESRLPQLQAEVALAQRLNALSVAIADARREENPVREAALQIEQELEKLATAEQRIKMENIPIAEQNEKITKAKLDAEGRIFQINDRLKTLREDEAKRNAEILSGLEDKGRLLQAKLDGNLEEVQLEMEVQKLLKDNNNLDEDSLRAKLAQNKALEEQVRIQEKLDQVYSSIGQSISTGIVDSLTAAVEGTKSLAEVAANTLRNVANILLQFGVNTALGGIGAAAGPGSFLGKLFGGFKASGGPVSAGKSYVVGERGPELFVPGTSGGIVSNDRIGGATNVVVNVDAKGSSSQGNEGQAKQLGQVIGAAVQAELIKQKRPGGLLS
tara:strand:+ start:552 stop:2993 length:2442 start_codon:yes stop_codon:yes gene_type:complete